MAISVTNDFIKMLALANGLNIPDERLERVRKQYEGYLQQLERINALELDREAEPATASTLEKDLFPEPPQAKR